MRIFRLAVLICAALFVSSALMIGQEKKMDMPGGIKGAFLKQSKFVEGQMESLAEAIPQSKYNWRPMKGVRSIAESFMHAALGNYITSSKITGAMAEGIDPKMLETSQTDKKKIVEALKKSFEVVNQAVTNCPESNFDKKVDFFGMDMNVLDMIMLGATHQHELLGQQIAYARMNKIVPPWTAGMQARMKEQETKQKEGMKKN